MRKLITSLNKHLFHGTIKTTVYNPLRSENMILRESTSPVYDTIQPAVWRNISKDYAVSQ